MELIRHLGGIQTSLHYVMDWYLWVSYLTQFGQDKVLRRPEVWARFRKHPDSKTMSCTKGFHAEALAVFRKLIDDSGAGDKIPFHEIELGGVPAAISLRDFHFGPHFRFPRFWGCYCDRVTGRLYHSRRYADARRWLALAQNLDPRFSWGRMKRKWRFLGKN